MVLAAPGKTLFYLNYIMILITEGGQSAGALFQTVKKSATD